jgi:1,4-dihydroxy-2-naphthoate polyprenyltransferase
LRVLAAFIRLGRPHFLAGGFIAFALGAAVARFEGLTLSFAAYASSQVAITAFQLMVHYANDYYDRAGDAFATPTLFSGGSGVLVGGHLPPRVALGTAIVCGAAGAALVAAFAFDGALALAMTTALIGILAWAYSAPPFRLLARGLGELDTVVVVALLVPFAGYAAFAHAVGARAVLATLPGAFAMFAMMLCVEVPDAGADAASGKRNLVVRWGARRALAVACAAAAAAVAALGTVLVTTFGVATAFAAGAALVPALATFALGTSSRSRLPAPATPLLGVTLYATVVLAALVAIANA